MDLLGKVTKEMSTGADLNVKLSKADERVGDVKYEKDGLEARLLHSQRICLDFSLGCAQSFC